ncbi:MAG: VapC toxin family PIN domain ribonuclease [Hydrogenophilales bacterium CG_4_10_14_3_um_filter_58_23]|nr:MAG: VapC toxin family PIN domain ribonuclease [Hydrogenophilales bacterium CG_4_10_14_3_um_filter_58_23]
MIVLDSNALVRYIAQNDPVQSPKATRLIESLAADELGYVSLVSVVELVWVLTGCYSSSKAEICVSLETLLRTKEIIVANADIVWKAVRLFKASNADFSDCLIERSASDAGCGYTATFDQGADKNCGMRLIE